MAKKTLTLLYKHLHTFFTILGIRPRFLRQLNNRLVHHLRSDSVIINGHIMYLDADDSMRLSTRGYYEPFITELVQNNVQEGNIVLDIGAHIGYYTLLFARIVGSKGKVYAFEPDPENFALLKKNVEANGYTNVVLEQKAVSNKNGKIKLYLGKERSAHHSTIKNKYSGSRSVNVASVRLDDVVKKPVDFIKIDVEGAEYYAFQGMKSIFKRSRNLKLVTEMVPLFLKNQHIMPESFVRLLHEADLKLYLIHEEKKRLVPFHLSAVLRHYNPQRKVNINLLCSKASMKSAELSA